MNSRTEPVQDIKRRRDGVLNAYVERIPFFKYLGISFERKGDELTGVLTYNPKLIGNSVVTRLHGGGTSAFLESTATMTLGWKSIWDAMEQGEFDVTADEIKLPPLPKTISITTDYLRPGLPRDAYARATITRAGRRYASVQVEAWQDHRDTLFAQSTLHFLMPGA